MSRTHDAELIARLRLGGQKWAAPMPSYQGVAPGRAGSHIEISPVNDLTQARPIPAIGDAPNPNPCRHSATSPPRLASYILQRLCKSDRMGEDVDDADEDISNIRN